ncbi:MAG: type II toxin-antitoxin system HicA family toxin [Cyanobacteria bacterium P01_F01_bin.150]
MPKKIRELKKILAKAGYVQLPKRGKGSHTFWVHASLLDEPLTIPGKDGDDAPRYLEKDVKQVLKKLKDLQQEEDS